MLKDFYYTGVGSRSTPKYIREMMTLFSSELESLNFTLRSGGADGADFSFEKGVNDFCKKEIYLPWEKFNGNSSNLFKIPEQAFNMASNVHPCWNKLSSGVKKLHARNVMQILGFNLNTPSKFLICWTKGGKCLGGTATAIKLAMSFNIKVYNLANVNDRVLLVNKIARLKRHNIRRRRR